MTDEITYNHDLTTSLSFAYNPRVDWPNERNVLQQEDLKGITNDPNKCLRTLPISSFIESSLMPTMNAIMRPSDAPDYAAGTDVDAAIADDGGVFTDETSDANNPNIQDVQLLPSLPAVDDAFYVGMPFPLSGVLFKITQNGVGTWTITWEYSTGSDTWVALSGVNDDTDGFTIDGTNYVTWTIPPDWATDTVNGQGPFYYVRGRVSDFTSRTTPPLGDQIWLVGEYPNVVLVIDDNITWQFPCVIMKAGASKSGSNKFGISLIFQERTL